MKTKPITPRETDVIRRIAANETTKQIAAALGLSCKTVEFHWNQAKLKLGLTSKIEATHYAIAKKLTPLNTFPKL